MFSLEMCHLLNYSFCFYFAIGPTFVLELMLHILCLHSLPPGSPGAPGVRFYTPESPGAKVVNGGGFPNLDRKEPRYKCTTVLFTFLRPPVPEVLHGNFRWHIIRA